MSKHKRPVRLEMIQVRVTKDEKDQIFANANGNASRWLRDLGLNPNSLVNKPRYKELKQDPKLVKEVASIGNNINQIARQINTV
ncbi:TPA: plasmid mobilization relaxosome protein MobC, partial [Vibrio parahaemolyticus]|nr:plasmid mobilization relaxosome protein MobC [Vibrio parahaemolyticus]